jgi:hypothetical protein
LIVILDEGGHCPDGKSDEKLYKILVRKPESNSPLEKNKLRWKDNMKTSFKETGYGGVD